MESEICNHVDAYLSEAMSFEEQNEFSLHLASCPQCQESKTRSQAIEAMLFAQNTGVFMRPQFQEQLLASLLEAKGVDLLVQRKIPSVGASTTVESSVFHRTARAVTLHKCMQLGIGVGVVAATILWAVFSLPNPSIDKTYSHPNALDLAHSQHSPTLPSEEERFPQRAAVLATPGYLCARLESDDSDIEFYVIRPVLQKN